MTIYMEMNADALKQRNIDWGRDNFSIEALQAIIDFTDEVYPDEDIAWTPVDLDCTWVEFNLNNQKDLEDFVQDYGHVLMDGDNLPANEDTATAVIEWLEEHTLIISSDWDCFVFDYNF
jgi:hypothetical protein